jgi:hypothetical protein
MTVEITREICKNWHRQHGWSTTTEQKRILFGDMAFLISKGWDTYSVSYERNYSIGSKEFITEGLLKAIVNRSYIRGAVERRY